MIDSESRRAPGAAADGDRRERSRLKQILSERPEERPRVRDAVVSLLGTAVAAIAIIGLLLIWHLKRRAQRIRDQLAPPRRFSPHRIDEEHTEEREPPSPEA